MVARLLTVGKAENAVPGGLWVSGTRCICCVAVAAATCFLGGARSLDQFSLSFAIVMAVGGWSHASIVQEGHSRLTVGGHLAGVKTFDETYH